ncbi:unnamed protein product [Clonostachys solani]|uniref:Heterokaryon incompatibility domain-containing protein n=1 Tax=Clonostachys solani TaxID=160281 RepID=A0A9P0EKZ7_9HYPO|nr:unnamed protein product [Clonostachys solani]
MEASEYDVHDPRGEDAELAMEPHVEEARQIATLTSPGCQVCQDLLEMFAASEEKLPATTQIVLGFFDEAMSTNCLRHKPLVEWFVDQCRQQPHEDWKEYLEILFRMGVVELFESVDMTGVNFNLALASKSPLHPDPVRKARIIDPEYIDLDIFKHWKNECLTSHGTWCQNSMKIWHTRPAWLVDVKQMCVVPGDDPAVGSSFIALSYLHGDGTATDQLGLMGAIYASAAVVIIATDGDAQEGISGLRGIPQSCPRKFDQWSFPFGGEETIVARDQWSSILAGGLYFTRGWTFQEYKMASRKIFLHDGLAHWECECAQWDEDLAHLEPFNLSIDPAGREILAGFPELSSLGRIIERYNELELRYEEDALPGITGLLSVLSRSFAGGFLYGIPEAFFDRVLGWIPLSSQNRVVRRVSSDRPAHLKFASGLPSWSWVGWQGCIRVGEEADRNHHLENSICETIPVTQWYTGEHPTTPPQERRRIRSSWYDQRSTRKKHAAELGSPLPDGWTRHEVKPGAKRRFGSPFLWPEGCGGYVYTHEKLPDNGYWASNTFFYPFPVPKITESTPPEMPKQTAYLFCATQRVRLWTRGEKILTGERENEYGSIRIHIHDDVGDAVGILRLNNEDQLEWLQAISTGTERGVQLELVAINRVLTRGNTYDEEKSNYDLPQWARDEYTVLWIEWEKGVAYRKAVGHIEKFKWENLQVEDVDLVLG